MFCTPIHLYVDRALWSNPRFFSFIMERYQNYTPGDSIDCALKSVPCDSKLASALSFSNDYNDFVYWFDLLVSYTAMTIVLVLGLFGNLINVVMFSTNKIANDSTNLLLLAVSLSDLGACCAQAPHLVASYLCFFDVSAAISGYTIVLPQTYHIIRCLSLLSLDFIVVIAVQRAGAVFVPFRASVIFSYRNTKVVVGIIIFVFTGAMMPFLLYYSPMWIFHPYFNKSISLHQEYHFGLSAKTILGYQLRYSSNRTIVNLCLTIFFVSATVVKLRYQSKSRARLQATDKGDNEKPKSEMSKREQKTVKMSLTVCFVTFIVYSINTMGNELSVPYISKLFETPMMAIVLFSGKVVTMIGCAFNFVLYMNISNPYRQAFKNMFARRQSK